MNGISEYTQRSSTNWGTPVREMLHESLQTAEKPSHSRAQWSILDDLVKPPIRVHAHPQNQIADALKKLESCLLIERVDSQSTLPPFPEMAYEGVHTAIPQSQGAQWSVLDDLFRQAIRLEAEQQRQLADLRKHYVMENGANLESFLRDHPALSQVLLEAAPYLRQHFGRDTVFTLRAPVDASGAQTLYGVVSWPGAVNDVRAALAEFDDSWWIGAVRHAFGNLTFTYELV
jgi:hypothetical protein